MRYAPQGEQRRRGGPHHVPTRRLLLLPVALLAALVVGSHLLASTTSRTPNPELAVHGLPPTTDDERRCSRHETDSPIVDEIRGAVDADHRVTSSAVAACPAAYDGLPVRYAGEVVGDILERDGGAWVLVNDDDYALAVGPLGTHQDHRGANSGLTVWLPTDLHSGLTGGGPGVRGDVIEVAGTVVRADPADGGGLTVRAGSLQVVARATAVDDPLDVPQLVLALIATVIATGLWGLRRRAVSRYGHQRQRGHERHHGPR